ncbi:MAG: FdtA/QdtA family cupin domain-containing protein [Flavobacteriia bacterium]|nr:FdtA/QdtA family cupin domain-containing protein [Flavobacteriia bacterium]
MSNEVRLINLPKIQDPRGNLTFLQNQDHFPFDVERVFWTYDVPGGDIRGGHAYKRQEEIIIALSGSFDVIVQDLDSNSARTFTLNRSYHALYLPPHTWRHVENFSTNAVALHLSSTKFDKDDYIRNIDELKSIQKNG